MRTVSFVVQRVLSVSCLALSCCLFTIGGSALGSDLDGEDGGSEELTVINTLSAEELIPGLIRPSQEVELGAPMESTIAQVLVKEGASVTRGEAIFVLDDRVASARLQAVQHVARQSGAIDLAVAELEYAHSKLQDLSEAHKAGASNPSEMTRAQIDVRLAEARLRQAKEAQQQAQLQVDLAKAQLETYTVRAPFDGVVVALTAEVGGGVRSGDPLATLQSISSLRAEMHLPVSEALSLKPGVEYAVTVDCGSSRVVPARLIFIDPRIDSGSATCRVVFRIANPDRSLLPGALVVPSTKEAYAEARGDTTWMQAAP
jgi:RND family efflux transporter MFP subunit